MTIKMKMKMHLMQGCPTYLLKNAIEDARMVYA
jgi:hypothetical protein